MEPLTITQEAPVSAKTHQALAIRGALDDELGKIRNLSAMDGQEFKIEAVDRLTELRTVVEWAREVLAGIGGDVVKAALKSGVDQEALVGKPYGETTVRKLAREAGLPRRPFGPRPRRPRP